MSAPNFWGWGVEDVGVSAPNFGEGGICSNFSGGGGVCSKFWGGGVSGQRSAGTHPTGMHSWLELFFKKQIVRGHQSLLWNQWYLCYGLLVTFALGFKSRVDTLACMLCCPCAMDSSESLLVQHLLTSWWSVWRPSCFPSTYLHTKFVKPFTVLFGLFILAILIGFSSLQKYLGGGVFFTIPVHTTPTQSQVWIDRKAWFAERLRLPCTTFVFFASWGEFRHRNVLNSYVCDFGMVDAGAQCG